tara:strand:+ start:137 stop:514 length:378 start_codon:yes stop_codon:yes gene_type:complete
MTSNTPIQYQIVEYITKDLLRPVQYFSEYNLQEKCYRVFANYRLSNNQPKGIRLTTWGKSRLVKAFDSYTFESDTDLTGKILIKLDEAMTWPYYVNKKTVILFNQTDAAWFKINGSSLKDYINII